MVRVRWVSLCQISSEKRGLRDHSRMLSDAQNFKRPGMAWHGLAACLLRFIEFTTEQIEPSDMYNSSLAMSFLSHSLNSLIFVRYYFDIIRCVHGILMAPSDHLSHSGDSGHSTVSSSCRMGLELIAWACTASDQTKQSKFRGQDTNEQQDTTGYNRHES